MRKILAIFLLVFFVVVSTNACADNSKKYYCDQNEDCMNSCLQGAVNTKWYENDVKKNPDVCMDGCANQTMVQPRCIEHVCTAFNYKGEKIDYCTKRNSPK